MKLYFYVTPVKCRGSSFKLLIISLLFMLLTLTTSYYYFIFIDRYSTSLILHQETSAYAIIKRPLCMEGILQRQQKSKKSAVPLVDLLTDGEDHFQLDNQRDCRLHHYDYQDVVACLDQLQLAKQKPLLIVFIGDSTAREQFHSFRQVFLTM